MAEAATGVLDQDSNDSLTARITESLQRMIKLGEFGMPMPPERQFAEIFGVSRITMRRAMSSLEEQGIIRREQGRGTYACVGPPIVSPQAVWDRSEPCVLVLTDQDETWFNPQLTPWTWHICRSLEHRLAGIGIGMSIVNSDRFLSMLAKKEERPDWLRGYMAPTHLWTPEKYETALKQNVPFVGLGRTSRSMYWNIIDPSPNPGLLEAIEDLAPGPDDLVFIPGDPYPPEVDRQVWLESCLSELHRHGVPRDHIVIRAGGMYEHQGYLAMRWYLKERGVPTMVLCDFDLCIVGVYRALAAFQEDHKIGDRPPIRFLGGNNMEIGRMLSPTLSTVSLSFDEIAERIVESLLEQQRTGKSVGVCEIPSRYIKRESSRKQP
ncbi:MAG: GntR family transcriptional regulator [Pirellulales bacterium]|nr:GntR family transcriptional regulator [Pirellulales bacterium]